MGYSTVVASALVAGVLSLVLSRIGAGILFPLIALATYGYLQYTIFEGVLENPVKWAILMTIAAPFVVIAEMYAWLLGVFQL